MTIEWNSLIERALAVRHNAHAPYSEFRVGAALLDDQGGIHAGCNVENVSYGLSVCAERHAVAAAVASGSTVFRALVVVTNVSPPGSPCGACRQVLAEFGDFPVLLVNPDGERVETSVGELLPMAFSPDDLAKDS
jgi:cytidine deaminase